jgi:hypothetical protein
VSGGTLETVRDEELPDRLPADHHQRSSARDSMRNLPVVLPLVALVIAGFALQDVDVSRMTDLGLVSVLPGAYFVALAVMASSFVLALRGGERPALLAFQMLATIILLYGVTVPLQDEPSFNVVYRHAGIVDHLLGGGALDPSIDAYFNWPGFFILAEFLVDLTGLDSVLPIAPYAPMVFNLLALPALVVIAKAAVSDWRGAWVGVWIFYLTNWAGQDYLAPQAYAFLLFLALAGAMLTTLAGHVDGPQRWWLRFAAAARKLIGRRADAPTGPDEVRPPEVTRLERSGVVLTCTILLAAIVASHQLTPFAALLLLLTLIAARRTTARWLPMIAALLIAAWLTFPAVDYLGGHGRELVSDALTVGSTVSANVGQRVSGSDDHLTIVFLRIALTSVLWLLAAYGIVRMLRNGRSAPSHALLAFVPLILAMLQPYGGEVLIRAYLFALPFVAILVAWALFPALGRAWTWRRSVGLLLASCVLMTLFLFTRYGNERAFLYTPDEREAVAYIYDNADAGDVVAAASTDVPWQDRRYDDFDYQLVSRLVPPPLEPESPRDLADRVARALDDRTEGASNAYLLLTRSQLNYEHMMGSLPWGTVRDLEEGAVQSTGLQLVYENADAMVFEVREVP